MILKDKTLHQAFILHSKAFKESSLIITALVKEYGVVNLLAKGAKRPKSKFRGVLLPFVPLLISYTGKKELYTLTDAERMHSEINIGSDSLINAIYINELVYKLVANNNPSCDTLFDLYTHMLEALSQNPKDVALLRYFEYELLAVIGYGIDLDVDAFNGEKIVENKQYVFNPYDGLFGNLDVSLKNNILVNGSSVVALRNRDLQSEQDFKEIKKMLRFAIMVHLKETLNSKMFYKKYKSHNTEKDIEIKKS